MVRVISLLFFMLCHFYGQAQSPKALALEIEVYELNNAFKYDSSVAVIQRFLSMPGITNNDLYDGYTYLSFTYKRLFDYPTTLRYLDTALYYGSKTNRKDFYIANTNCQKALALFDVSSYAESGRLMQALAKNNYQHLDDADRSVINMQEAYVMYLDKNFAAAETRYNEAIEKMRSASPCNLPMIYAKKIELYGATGNKAGMKEAYEKSIRSSDSCSILKYNLYTNEMMTKTYKEQGNFKEAFYYLKIYDSLNILYNEREYLGKLLESDKKYLLQKNNQQMALQQKTIQAKNRSIGFLIASVIGLVLAAVSFQLWQRQKKLKQENESAINYTRQILEKTEEERKRIAAELHDSISHELLNLKYLMADNPSGANTKIDSIINDIRIISRNLHPVLFERLGLKSSIEQMVERVQQQHHFLLTTEMNYNRSLPVATELQVYRILQEAITNMVKHANALAGKITITEGPGNVMIEIKDNGNGFDVAENLNSTTAFGLHTITERTRAIGGAANISSSGKGTTILISIPKK